MNGTRGTTVVEGRSDSAIRHAAAHALLWGTAALALAADLGSKHWAFTALGPEESRPALFGLLSFQRSLNDGALFGMGKGLVPLFILASILAVGFILYFFAGSDRRQRLLHLALAFILAGALGNLFDRTFLRADRIVLKGPGNATERVLGVIVGERTGDAIQMGFWPHGDHPRTHGTERLTEPPRSVGIVRDFIKIQAQIAGRDVWPWVFNVADALLVMGVGVLLVGFVLERRGALWASPTRVPT